MNKRKILAMLLAVVMICSLFVSPALAADDEGIVAISANTEAPKFTDLEEGHWAESAIIRWAEEGIIEGDGDGTINPARSLKRAELATVLTRLLGLKDKASADTFSDVAANAWYADAVLKCAKAGIMLGDGTGKANPEAPIDRQQTIVMVGRALGVKPATGHSLDRFDDGDTVADWAAPYMIALTDMNILNGLPTGEGDGAIVAPTVNIDRASTFTLLDKAIAQYITAPCTVTVNDPNKFVVINSAAEEAGIVTVTGETAGVVVATGTTDDVVLNKADVGTLKVDAPVDVTVNKGSSVDDLDANAAAKIDNKGDVTNLNTNADEVTFDGNKPSKVNTAEDVKPATDSKGNEVTEAPTSSGSNNGGSTGPRPTQKADLVPAPLFDQAGIIEEADLGKITVTSSKVSGSDNEYNVTVKGENIMNHTSANAGNTDGHWVGFGMPAAPENDTFKYTVDGSEVPTIAGRTIEVNGKTYNTVYISEENDGTYAEHKIVVTNSADETVATYNVTCDVTFWSVADAAVKVLANEADTATVITKLEENGTPWAHKFAKGLGLTAAVSGNTITLDGETTLAKLESTYLGTPGCDGYLTYVLQVTDKAIKGIKLGNNVAALDELDLEGISLVMNKKIYDGTAKSFASAATTYSLTDAAGRVQDEVTVTVDASAVTIKGMNTVSFVDHDGKIVEKKFVTGEAEITTPAAPERDGYYFTGWGVETAEGQMTLYAAGATVQITGDTTFTAQYVEIKAQTAALRKDGPEGNNDPAVDSFPYATTYGKAGITFDATTNTITLDATKLMEYKATEDNQLNHLLGGNGKTLFVGLEYAAPQGATQYAWAATAEALRNETLTALSTDTQSTYGNALITYIAFAELENDEFNFLADVEDNANNALESTPYILWADAEGAVVGVTKATLSRKTVKKPTTYTVTFDTTEVETGYDGKLSTIPAVPAKVGYTGKWVVDGEEVTTDTVFTADATAEAVYTPNYEVSFTAMSNAVYGLYAASGSGFDTGIPESIALFQEDIAFEAGKDACTFAVTGTLNTVTAYTDFNQALTGEQSGYYLLFQFVAPEGTKDGNVSGNIVTTDKKSFTTAALDKVDGEGEVFSFIWWVAAPETQNLTGKTIKLTIDWDGEGGKTGTEYTLDLSGLTLKATATTPDQGEESTASLSAVETEEVIVVADAIVPSDDEVMEIPVLD